HYHTTSCYSFASKKWTKVDDNWMRPGSGQTWLIKQIDGDLIATAEGWHAAVRCIDRKPCWFSNVEKRMVVELQEGDGATDLLEYSGERTIIGYSTGAIGIFNKQSDALIFATKYKFFNDAKKNARGSVS